MAGLAVVVTACSLIPGLGGPSGGAYPEACAQFAFSLRRCEAVVDRALADGGIAARDVATIHLLPFERKQTLGGGQVALVEFRLNDGTVVTQDVKCVGVSQHLACTEMVEIPVDVGVMMDVPCEGEPPDGCATMPPTPAPDQAAQATPLLVESLDIELDRLGTYEVEVGRASLPDGYLSERSFRLENPAAETFWIDEGVRLIIRPDDPSRPDIGSRYRDPYAGPEPVTVYLAFDVTDLDEPSMLRVRDIVVR